MSSLLVVKSHLFLAIVHSLSMHLNSNLERDEAAAVTNIGEYAGEGHLVNQSVFFLIVHARAEGKENLSGPPLSIYLRAKKNSFSKEPVVRRNLHNNLSSQ